MLASEVHGGDYTYKVCVAEAAWDMGIVIALACQFFSIRVKMRSLNSLFAVDTQPFQGKVIAGSVIT